MQADGGNRQYFRNCYIEGNVDWIFGSAQAVFDDCDIVANGDGYVTAASTESTRSTGYVFINSRLLKKGGTWKTMEIKRLRYICKLLYGQSYKNSRIYRHG